MNFCKPCPPMSHTVYLCFVSKDKPMNKFSFSTVCFFSSFQRMTINSFTLLGPVIPFCSFISSSFLHPYSLPFPHYGIIVSTDPLSNFFCCPTMTTACPPSLSISCLSHPCCPTMLCSSPLSMSTLDCPALLLGCACRGKGLKLNRVNLGL